MRYAATINAAVAVVLGVTLGKPIWFATAFIWSGWVWVGPAWRLLSRRS